MDELYEAAAILIVFPLIVAAGAGDPKQSKTSLRLCRFSGAISYPLYIMHFPLIYVYTTWVVDRKITPAQGVFYGAGIFVTALAIAYASLKLYDEPVRRWLTKRFL